jgi:hypothetical protein
VPVPLFLVGAIVLVTFGIIGDAGTGTLFGTGFFIWFMAAFLSYLVHCLFESSPLAGYYVRRSGTP